jgi:hypothetical protein
LIKQSRDEASVVVTWAPVNRMKTDLTEEQFKNMVRELAKVFDGGTFDERAALDFEHARSVRLGAWLPPN